MTEAERISLEIAAKLPLIKRGSLRLWGCFFGRPYDNFHRVIGSETSTTLLIVHFHSGESLTVWNPRGATIDANWFQILSATRVRWEWYLYGTPKTPTNHRFIDFEASPTGIRVESDIEYWGSDDTPNLSLPAVELL